MSDGAQSFYFFDFDKNIMRVEVEMVLTNTVDGSHRNVSVQKLKEIQGQLGKEGPWQDWSDKDRFLNYRDQTGVSPEQQPFARQIRTAIESGDPKNWQGLAWGVFVYVCRTQRPFTLITARGHSDETVKAGFEVLKEAGLIEKTPNYFSIYNVTFPRTVELLDKKDSTLHVDELKRRAIIKTVDDAVKQYGVLPHHFGMSDDTMKNVEAGADAMVSCKIRYPDMRFFVIATNAQHRWKAELFPANVPVAGHGDEQGEAPIGS